MGTTHAVDRRLLHLSPQDNVCVAVVAIAAGATLHVNGSALVSAQDVPMGHKIAVRPIPAGGKVLKYGAVIGSATCDIEPGQWVHTHNLKSDYLPPFGHDGLPEAE